MCIVYKVFNKTLRNYTVAIYTLASLHNHNKSMHAILQVVILTLDGQVVMYNAFCHALYVYPDISLQMQGKIIRGSDI